MRIKLQGSYLVSALILIILVWVFSRPLSGLGLYVYNFTGSYLSTVYKKLLNTQQEAGDLLVAQEKLITIKAENKKLKLENSKLRSKVNKVDDLKKQLKTRRKLSFDTVPAQIIGRSPDTWHKQIIVNKGAQDGIKVGKAVITEKGIVGQITKVNFQNSIAQLIFDKNYKVGAKVSRSKIFGVLSGGYPGAADLEFIPVGSNIKVGDRILSSGVSLSKKDPTYPENYPIGRVVEILRNPDALDLIVKVKLNEELKDIREVFILK